MSTIPASTIAAVTPGVLAAGGAGLALIGLLLTSSTRVPIGAVQPFATADDVTTYFGSLSDESLAAQVYFGGFTNSNIKPGSILFAQYPGAAVVAYLRGGNISGLTLTQLQALNGTLNVTIDAVLKTGTVNLAGVTSFSNAAQVIADTLDIESGVQTAAFTAAIAGTVMTVSAVGSGALAVGQFVHGTGVTADTYIVSLGTGTGGTGTYNVSISQTVASEAMTTKGLGVTYDSVSGAFVVGSSTTGPTSTITVGSGAMATSLLLTTATGAVLSQGAAAGVPATFMDAVVQTTQNWASFTTIFNPDSSGNTNKLAFVAWNNTKNNRYVYVPWDTDATPTTTVPATGSLGYLISQANYSGTVLVYAPDYNLSVFVCGVFASIDFSETDGRTTLKFRQQSGLIPSVTDATTAANLAANGYNFYGAYGVANTDFEFLANGVVSGPFVWADSYVNQIWQNNGMQLALINFMTAKKSIPYNSAGYSAIEAALQDQIDAGLNFGVYRAGVTLSSEQISEVNQAAGVSIAGTLQTRGWYLQIKDASPTVRAARGSPPATFWYVNGESVQTINLASIELQ